MTTIYKIDLDLETKDEAITQLKNRIEFLDKIKLLPKNQITKVQLVYKKKYSAKIYHKKKPRKEIHIIMVQAILGDDYKRIGVTYRDFLLGIKNYNRLFDVKLYRNGEYITSTKTDITKEVLSD